MVWFTFICNAGLSVGTVLTIETFAGCKIYAGGFFLMIVSWVIIMLSLGRLLVSTSYISSYKLSLSSIGMLLSMQKFLKITLALEKLKTFFDYCYILALNYKGKDLLGICSSMILISCRGITLSSNW